MSDIKFCDSCGNRLSIAALFCPKCGQKQNPLPVSEPIAPTENVELDSVNEAPVIREDQVIEEEQIINQEQIFEENSVIDEKAAEQSNDINDAADLSNETIQEPTAEPIKEEDKTLVQPEAVKPATPQLQNTYIQQPQQQSKPQPIQQPQPQLQPQPQPQYQSPYYPQAVQTHGVQPQDGVVKKKFPWVFTVLWIILLGAVGVWAYFLLVHPTYDYPRFTEDAQRIALFTAAIAALIYTLSLKLTMRKLKALPTVIMILLAIVGFFFFCMVELQDGDLLHDTISTFVESIIP